MTETEEKTYVSGCRFEKSNWGTYDHLGSTRLSLSVDNAPTPAVTVPEILTYSAYGEQEFLGGPQVDKTKESFTGKEFDQEGQIEGENGVPGMKLYYFGARYYDPVLGKWTSVDPKREFYDSYRYTTNPIGFIDPDGLAELRLALYMKDWNNVSAAKLQNYLATYVQEGDNLKVQAFTPTQKQEMYTFLKSGDKIALGAHGGVGSFGVTYAFSDNESQFISYDALTRVFTDILKDYTLFIDACGAEENFTYLKDQGLEPQHLKAAPGAAGESMVPSNAARALGIDLPEEKKK
jgi:RHS repeat-associated protein